MAFGQAMGAAFGFGGGGGNRTMQNSMMQRGQMGMRPQQQGPGMMGGMGRPQAPPAFGTQGPGKMRPQQGFFGNPGIGPMGRFGQQMGQMGMGMGYGQQKMQPQQPMQPPEPQRMPPVEGESTDGPQRQVMNPNAPGYDRGWGGGMQTQGGPANDPRWSNGTWGGQRQGGIGPRPGGLWEMMQRMQQQQPFDPNYQQPDMVNNGWGKMIPREQAEAFRRGGGVA